LAEPYNFGEDKKEGQDFTWVVVKKIKLWGMAVAKPVMA
jgi:hypothetical protein